MTPIGTIPNKAAQPPCTQDCSPKTLAIIQQSIVQPIANAIGKPKVQPNTIKIGIIKISPIPSTSITQKREEIKSLLGADDRNRTCFSGLAIQRKSQSTTSANLVDDLY